MLQLMKECIHLSVVALEGSYVAKISVGFASVYIFACVNNFYIFGCSKAKK